MRPRTEAAIGAAVLLVLGAGAALLGSREGRTTDDDARASTYLAGPQGARGYAEALERLGVRVERSRARTRETVSAIRSDSTGGRRILAIIGPSMGLDPDEAVQLAGLALDGGADLLVAGGGARALAECFGFRVVPVFPTVPVSIPGAALPGEGEATARVRSELEPLPRTGLGDGDSDANKEEPARRSAFDDGTGSGECRAPLPDRVDTLFRTPAGLAAVRLTLDSASVTLLADHALLTNRTLRTTNAGPVALSLVAGRNDVVVFDEFHHGFRAGGSLMAALFAWSTRSPWGWALWQLVVVAVLALLAGAIRFGPARAVVPRRRRSPLEHVRALATALSAARGHDVAVGLIVLGLRRRLARPGESIRGDPRAWLDGLTAHVRTPASRTAVATLRSLTDRPQGAHAVRAAADAVEDVWQDLKP